MPSTDRSDLGAAREAVVREHMASENRLDFDATIATFGHPRYELVATGQVFDGEEQVRRYYEVCRRRSVDRARQEIRSRAMTLPVLDLPHVHSGKVRDLYEVDGDHLLLVTSDRLSVFDVVMTEPVPDKGRVLTAMSAFWFEHLADVAPSHLVSTELADLPAAARLPELAGRVMLCRRAEMVSLECIVRGYLTGSAWKEYRADGTMHGAPLPAGLEESAQLPEPVFTPSTKAPVGEHDVNLSEAEAAELIGEAEAGRIRDLCLELYRRGAAWAADRGIIIADTKFELGYVEGELVVCDEALTPDSSRFWPAESWRPGATPPSFDKQPVRDLLDTLDWDKSPPPPTLSDEVVAATRARYVEAYERLTGRSLAAWPG